MEPHPILQLATLLAAAPRYAVVPVTMTPEQQSEPALRRQVAAPASNIETATDLLRELDGNKPPIGVRTTLAQAVGLAATSLSDPASLLSAWQGVLSSLRQAEAIAPVAVRPQLSRMVAIDAGIASVLASGATLLSQALDALNEIVLAELEAIGRPGCMATVQQLARRIAVSDTHVYREAGKSIPVQRIGRALRFDLADVERETREAPDNKPDAATPKADRTQRSNNGPRRSGSVPGTGTKAW